MTPFGKRRLPLLLPTLVGEPSAAGDLKLEGAFFGGWVMGWATRAACHAVHMEQMEDCLHLSWK